MPRINAWIGAVIPWVGVIFFSSTSLASHWAERTFSYFSDQLFSQMPRDSNSFGLVHLLADKGFHVSLFCVLAILLWQAFRSSSHRDVLILLSGAVVGSCSEILQSFFPDRDPALRDVFINIGGTTLGLGFCHLVSRLFFSRRSPVKAEYRAESNAR